MQAVEKQPLTDTPGKRENLVLNLVFNVFIPSLVLIKFSNDHYLGTTGGLLTSLAFPLAYGIYTFLRNHSINILSVTGILAIIATGSIGLMQLNAQWIAVKEASVPLIVGLALLLSLRTPFPLCKKLITDFINAPRVYQALHEAGHMETFERRMVQATYLFAASFFLSSILNYVLARVIVVSEPGTIAFNQELGQMTLLSLPVIGTPMAILIGVACLSLLRDLRRQTGLTITSIFR